jgi:hypothetical protein
MAFPRLSRACLKIGHLSERRLHNLMFTFQPSTDYAALLGKNTCDELRVVGAKIAIPDSAR